MVRESNLVIRELSHRVARKLKVIVNAIPAANPVTGIGRYVLQLYSAIGEIAGNEVQVQYFDGRQLSTRPPQPPADLRRFSRLGTLFWRLPVRLSLAVRLAIHRRREGIFRRLSAEADIYHETAFFPFEPAAGVRIVQTVHDLSLQFHPQWHPAERVEYARRYFAQRLGWASRILCVSEFTRSELVRFDAGTAGRTSISHLGVDRRFGPVSGEAHEEIRRRYRLPNRYLLFVGSGDPRKNARALGEIIARGRLPCEVVCVGWAGWLAGEPLRGVRMLGYLPDKDLPALYGAATAFVFPSLYEGFGLPVLEAMACGCPVVVPRAHSMPELVGEAGAYYGAAGDTDALERTLIDLVADTDARARLSASGLERSRRFDWAETARATLGAFAKA
jgi:glycosyltransferase involved in cell wall biosynthesis